MTLIDETGNRKKVDPTDIDLFLWDLIMVCIKHRMSLAHEDNQGAFLVENFRE
jgi:hypothetical protein